LYRICHYSILQADTYLIKGWRGKKYTASNKAGTDVKKHAIEKALK
jgi:hypothetical protein